MRMSKAKQKQNVPSTFFVCVAEVECCVSTKYKAESTKHQVQSTKYQASASQPLAEGGVVDDDRLGTFWTSGDQADFGADLFG